MSMTVRYCIVFSKAPLRVKKVHETHNFIFFYEVSKFFSGYRYRFEKDHGHKANVNCISSLRFVSGY